MPRFSRFLRAIVALTLREMSTSYGRSSLGYLWALLEPLGAIILLSVAFSLAFSNPPLGVNFPLFYATGFIPFLAYSTMQQRISVTLRENHQLLFYPSVNYLDAITSRFILIFATQLVVALVVYSGIMLLYGLEQSVSIARIVFAFSVACFLGLGIGMLNAVIFYFMPSWQHVWNILNRPLFLCSCVFYLLDSLPRWAQSILWYNPLVHLVGETRRGFYATYRGFYIDVAYPALTAVILICLSLLLLRRYSKDMLH